jgi:hypothetical protein
LLTVEEKIKPEKVGNEGQRKVFTGVPRICDELFPEKFKII